MNAADRFNALQPNTLFSALSREGLLDLAGAASDRTFAAGEVVIREGATDEMLYIIVSGAVNIVKGHETDMPEVIATRGPGEVLGEMSLLERQPRFAAVVASGPVQVISISFKSFRYAFEREPIAMWQMLAVLSQKLRQAQQGRYNDLLRRHAELSQLASFQRDFLSVVNHELMTPVANVVMGLEVLWRSLQQSGATLQTIQPVYESLASNVGQMKGQVQTLLNYANLILAQEEMTMQVVDLAELVRLAVAAGQKQAQRAGVRIAVDIKDETLVLPGDRRRLTEAMAHLLDNGIKYNRKGAVTTIRVWWDDGFAYFEVSDQGEGVPPERLARLWEPFTQMSDAVKRGVEGLGLGLAIVRYIAKAHGGDVWAESRPGQGSKFGFKVPRAV